MLIEEGHPAANQNPRRFWEEELKNSYIILSDINQKIHKLEIENYSFDSGQTNIQTKRSGLDSLIAARENTLKRIQEITAIIAGIDNAGSRYFAQAVPQW